MEPEAVSSLLIKKIVYKNPSIFPLYNSCWIGKEKTTLAAHHLPTAGRFTQFQMTRQNSMQGGKIHIKNQSPITPKPFRAETTGNFFYYMCSFSTNHNACFASIRRSAKNVNIVITNSCAQSEDKVLLHTARGGWIDKVRAIRSRITDAERNGSQNSKEPWKWFAESKEQRPKRWLKTWSDRSPTNSIAKLQQWRSWRQPFAWSASKRHQHHQRWSVNYELFANQSPNANFWSILHSRKTSVLFWVRITGGLERRKWAPPHDDKVSPKIRQHYAALMVGLNETRSDKKLLPFVDSWPKRTSEMCAHPRKLSLHLKPNDTNTIGSGNSPTPNYYATEQLLIQTVRLSLRLLQSPCFFCRCGGIIFYACPILL